MLVREHDELLSRHVQLEAELNSARAKAHSAHVMSHELRRLREQLEDHHVLQEQVCGCFACPYLLLILD